MEPVRFSDFVDAQGQEQAARSLGVSQAAISKALSSGRLIFVIPSAGGVCTAIELKEFPATTPRPEGLGRCGAIMEKVVAIGEHLHRSGHLSSSSKATHGTC
jgi:hypothetical protein